MSPPKLPPEILLAIVDAVALPTRGRQTMALPPDHLTTRTLLALCYVSRAVYPISMRLLYRHCLYIDSELRLSQLATAVKRLQRRAEPGNKKTLPTTLPPTTALNHARSLYLEPCGESHRVDELVTMDTAVLLQVLAPSLQQLIINMPLRSFDVYDGIDDDSPESLDLVFDRHTTMERQKPLISAMREAFAKLTSLEVFCSVQDELFLPTSVGLSQWEEAPVWVHWTKLRILAQYNPELSDNYFDHVVKLPALRTLVATRADGLEMVDIKADWSNWAQTAGMAPVSRLITLVNTSRDHTDPFQASRWRSDDMIAVRRVDVPISYYGDDDEIYLCQEYTKRAALREELDRMGGELIVGTP